MSVVPRRCLLPAASLLTRGEGLPSNRLTGSPGVPSWEGCGQDSLNRPGSSKLVDNRARQAAAPALRWVLPEGATRTKASALVLASELKATDTRFLWAFCCPWDPAGTLPGPPHVPTGTVGTVVGLPGPPITRSSDSVRPPKSQPFCPSTPKSDAGRDTTSCIPDGEVVPAKRNNFRARTRFVWLKPTRREPEIGRAPGAVRSRTICVAAAGEVEQQGICPGRPVVRDDCGKPVDKASKSGLATA